MRNIQVSNFAFPECYRSFIKGVTAKQHARRVQEKLGVEAGLIYLQGQQAKNNEDSDMPAPFRQRRYFYYLSGFVEHVTDMKRMLMR